MIRREFIRGMMGAVPLLYSGAAIGSEAQPTGSARLAGDDVALIAETYHLWTVLGETVWSGWTMIPMPILYITQEYEHAIGFPKLMRGFQALEQDALPGRTIQVRKRVFGRNLSASFEVEGTPAVVIGAPATPGSAPEAWVVTVAHEMFHVLQSARGSVQKVRALKLGSETDASWQLNFPFPYHDADVMRLIHLQGYPIYLAATGPDEAEAKYNAGTAVDAIHVYRSLLKAQSKDDHFYDYSQFQEWSEGIASYTEYRMAKAAADASYQPSQAFARLAGFKGYRQLWEESYKNRLFLIKHAGRAARSRTAFYHLGFGKGLLLDRLMPDWKTRYFAPGTWLDDLLIAATG
jgi:hypothetical protein